MIGLIAKAIRCGIAICGALDCVQNHVFYLHQV
jgi:hypothetical protein